MDKIVGIIVLALLVTVASKSIPRPKIDPERAAETTRNVDARMAIQNMARDPSSVQFRDIRVTGTVVCGWFNARNGFGGMSGYQPFVYVNEQAFADVDEYAKYCTRVSKSDRL